MVEHIQNYLTLEENDFDVKEEFEEYSISHEFTILTDSSEPANHENGEMILPDDSTTKRRQINLTQEDMIVEFMKKYPQLACKGAGRDGTKRERYKNEKRWQELVNELNLVGPPKRNRDGWMRAWLEKKAVIQRKVNAIKSGNDVFLSSNESAVAFLSGMFDDVEVKSEEEIIQDLEEESKCYSPPPDNSSEVYQQQDNRYSYLVKSSESLEDKDELSHEPASSNTLKRKRQDNSIQQDVEKSITTNETKSYVDIATELNKLHNALEGGRDLLKKVEENTQNILGELNKLAQIFVKHSNAMNRQTEEMVKHRMENERHHRVMEKIAHEKLLLKKQALKLQKEQMNTI
ncbi:uncharacterized protein LOC142230105 [Haematobia irritans]|uniref:uncharacterized protein LOC142230105 n=1 Tax=Haematobia irritans TaxID=7368 RepID=UPI003F4F762E